MGTAVPNDKNNSFWFFFPPSKVRRQTEAQQSKNEKALYTTLMIVGSVVVGWMPACLQYYLICTDCIVKPDWANFTVRFYTYFSTNCLVILKSGINSYIYAARMQEIQVNIINIRRIITFYYYYFYQWIFHTEWLENKYSTDYVKLFNSFIYFFFPFTFYVLINLKDFSANLLLDSRLRRRGAANFTDEYNVE